MKAFFPVAAAVLMLSSMVQAQSIHEYQAPYNFRAGHDGGTYMAVHGECRFVENNASTMDVFIPYRSAEEWASFKRYAPSGVALERCCTPRSVNFCGGNRTIDYGRIGDRTTVAGGHSMRLTYQCSATGDWVPVGSAGQCEAPEPVPVYSCQANGHSGWYPLPCSMIDDSSVTGTQRRIVDMTTGLIICHIPASARSEGCD